MNIGTKSLLFGCHQFLIHPIAVVIAWRRLYHKWPSLSELLAIFIHDLGYFGASNMDGEEGESHPLLAYHILKNWRPDLADLCIRHSRFYCRGVTQPSKLCWADKLGNAILPVWLYAFLGSIGGEIAEYSTCEKHEGDYSKSGPRDFFLRYRGVVRKVLLNSGIPEVEEYALNHWNLCYIEYNGKLNT